MVRRSSTGLAGKLGDKGRKAVDSHKGDDTRFASGGDLPAGIEGGVAQLVDCKFDTYKKGDNEGEYYFYCAGVVKSPAEHDGVNLIGLRTSIMEPVCETPTRTRQGIEEHVDWILNEFRKLNIDTSELAVDDLEDVAAALKEARPHFRFRTWKGEKSTSGPFAGREPMVQHQWNGACDFTDDSPVDSVVDETDGVADPPSNSTAPDTEKYTPSSQSEIGYPTTEDSAPGHDQAKLKALADRAEAEDEAAQSELTDLAADAGLATEAAEADSWQAVADMLVQGNGDSVSFTDLGIAVDEVNDPDETSLDKLIAEAETRGLNHDDYSSWENLGTALDGLPDDQPDSQPDGVFSHPHSADSDWAPEVGEVYLYKPPRSKKPVECEVTVVNSADEVVTLKSLDDGKSFTKVKWDSLSS